MQEHVHLSSFVIQDHLLAFMAICFHQRGIARWMEQLAGMESCTEIFKTLKCCNSKVLRDRTKVQRQIYALWPEEHYQTIICIKSQNRFYTGFFKRGVVEKA